MFPSRSQEKGARPYFPHLLLMVEGSSGLILGNELLMPEPGLKEILGFEVKAAPVLRSLDRAKESLLHRFA